MTLETQVLETINNVPQFLEIVNGNALFLNYKTIPRKKETSKLPYSWRKRLALLSTLLYRRFRWDHEITSTNPTLFPCIISKPKTTRLLLLINKRQKKKEKKKRKKLSDSSNNRRAASKHIYVLILGRNYNNSKNHIITNSILFGTRILEVSVF